VVRGADFGNHWFKITRKENSFEIYLSLSYAPARLTQLVCVHSHISLLGGVGVKHPSSVVYLIYLAAPLASLIGIKIS